MRPTSKGFAEDAREFVTQPAFDLLVVTFAGLAFRLLAGPAQALLENLADVFGVQGDAKALLDQACHAVGGPQLVGPTVLVSALAEEVFEFVELVVGELAWAAWDGFGIQTVRFSGHTSPAVNGGRVDARIVRRRQGIRPVRPIPRHGDGGVEFGAVPMGLMPLLYRRSEESGSFPYAGLSSHEQPSGEGRSLFVAKVSCPFLHTDICSFTLSKI